MDRLEYSDPIVIPITLTIPDPRWRPQHGRWDHGPFHPPIHSGYGRIKPEERPPTVFSPTTERCLAIRAQYAKPAKPSAVATNLDGASAVPVDVVDPNHERLADILAQSAPATNPSMPTALDKAGQVDRLPTRADLGPIAFPAADASAAPGQPVPVTADQLRAIMPGAGARADRYADALNQAMTAHDINTPEQRAAFLAQIAVETRDLHDTVENLDYSTARRIRHVFPRSFDTDAKAQPYVRNPEALANRVYAGQIGNGDEASGDGYTFRGRGLIQLTGRNNYRDLGFEGNPESLAEPQDAASSAASFWQNKGLNERALGTLNRKRFNAVTHTINAGSLQSRERWEAYQRGVIEFSITQ